MSHKRLHHALLQTLLVVSGSRTHSTQPDRRGIGHGLSTDPLLDRRSDQLTIASSRRTETK